MTEGGAMMRCDEVMARLWEFLDGEISGPEEEALRHHLEVCGRCYPQYDFRRAYLRYARRLSRRDPAPAEFRRRLFKRLLELERMQQSKE